MATFGGPFLMHICLIPCSSPLLSKTDFQITLSASTFLFSLILKNFPIFSHSLFLINMNKFHNSKNNGIYEINPCKNKLGFGGAQHMRFSCLSIDCYARSTLPYSMTCMQLLCTCPLTLFSWYHIIDLLLRYTSYLLLFIWLPSIAYFTHSTSFIIVWYP